MIKMSITIFKDRINSKSISKAIKMAIIMNKNITSATILNAKNKSFMIKKALKTIM